MTSMNSFRLPDGSTVDVQAWTEGDCAFIPYADPCTFTLDERGVLPLGGGGGEPAVDLRLASTAEWLVMGVTVLQESEVLRPPCWLTLEVSHKAELRLDVAALLMPTVNLAMTRRLAVPIHIGGTERFALRQGGADANRIAVTLHLMYKHPFA